MASNNHNGHSFLNGKNRGYSERARVKDSLLEILRIKESRSLRLNLGPCETYEIWTSGGWEYAFDAEYKEGMKIDNMNEFYEHLKSSRNSDALQRNNMKKMIALREHRS